MTLPYGGYLGYDYTTTTYLNGLSYRDVAHRYLSKDGSTQTTYPFSHEPSPGQNVHQYTILDDPGGVGEKYWAFSTSGFTEGLATQYQGRQLPGPVIKIQNDFTWAQDTAPYPNSYISSTLTTADPGQSFQAQKQTNQIVDIYGNVTQVQNFDWGLSTYKKYTYTYLSGTGSHTYITDYMQNRLLSAVVTDGTSTITLVQNSYDSGYFYNGQYYGPNYGPGVVTRLATLKGISTFAYNSNGTVRTGMVNGVITNVDYSSSPNYAAPSLLTVGSLSQSFTYTQYLSPLTATGSNADMNSVVYLDISRPTSTTSPAPYNLQTNYTYPSVNVATAAVNGRWTRTTKDGLGRTIKVENGTGTIADANVVSQTDTAYDSCGCSPLGKLKQASLPHARGAGAIWTTYTYDGIGRTLSVLQPDGASTTTYSYQGNTVTATDPAGAWKTYTSDAFGRLKTVQEPNPAGGTFVTNYTYDLLDHLTDVSMPRPTGTQTRHFAYNNTAFLQSATNPENGTVTYTYDSLNRLSTVVDAKNQQKVFTYDSYNRVTQVQRYVKSGGAFVEDPMQRTNFYYDSNPFGTSTYVAGRLAAVQYYGGHCSSYVPSGTQSGCDLIQEWYGYNQAGARLSKTVKITRGSQVGSMTVSWTYDNEGRPLKVTYPGGGSCTTCTPSTGSSYTNAYDTMGRPNTLTDTVNTRTLVSGITYGVANEVQQLTSGYTTGVNSESNTYNSMFQLTQLQVGSSALNIQYNYSATQNNGKISSQTDALSGEQIAYTYDALNRLASAQTTQTGGTQWGQSYTYDGFGNLTDQTVIKGGAPDVHVAYNYLTNQQTGDTADANGNIGAGYIYDLENRLVQPGSSSPVHYGYDAGNKRIWRGDSTSGLDEFALWGAGQKLATYQITANAGLVNFALTSTRVYFGHKLISTGTYNSSGTGDKVTLTPVVADRQGSIKKFYPFGTERPSATRNDTEKFTGYFRDAATGLDYADQRYEQPGTGRFITPDPSSGGATTSDPGSWHKYAYTRGDPVNRIDPQGLADFSVTGTGHFYPEYFPWDPYYIFVQGSYQLNYSSDQGGDGGLDGVDALRWIWGMASARAALDAFVNMKFSEKCADSIQNALGGQAGFQGLTKSGSDFGALAAVQLIASGAKIADGSNTTDPVGVTAFPLDPDLAAKIQSTADVQSGIPNTPMSIVFLLNPRLMAMGQFDGDTIFVNPSAFLQSGSGMNLYTMFHESLHLAGFYDAQLEGLLGIPDSVVKSLGSTSITFKLMELCNQ